MSNYIDRQTAINALGERPMTWTDSDYELGSADQYDQDRSAIEAVPSAAVQPVQRGHWQEAKTRTYGIYECDVCKGWTYIPNEPRDYKFCPRCGARMDGEQNDTD